MTNPTKSGYRDKLAAEVRAIEAEIELLREAKAKRKDAADRDVSEEERTERKQLSTALNKARGRLDQARALLERYEKSGREHAIVVQGDRIKGTIAVRIPPGGSSEQRLQLLEDALTEQMAAAVDELGVVLAAAPVKYVRERPGRDAEGQTIFDVDGLVEGDFLVPAVRAAKTAERRKR
ncbi:MAG TPA: hypothetical protein PKA58_16150 [Polyangium sp.]|jgi:hypothetical protein|nr:hypothetical protein [Polyangium sp.]